MSQNKPGLTLPMVQFHMREKIDNNEYQFSKKSTSDLFDYKRVLVFSLPGAFTTTCTKSQLPEFEKIYDQIKDAYIDEVYCISVNDAFVMKHWADHFSIEKIKMIPDGNGDFTEGLDMLVNKKHLGMGYRSWRYAMVVNHGVIEAWWEELGKNQVGSDRDPYAQTTPDIILKYLESVAENYAK